MHAGRGVGIKSDSEIYIAATDDIYQSAKTVNINATDQINLSIGDSNVVTIDKDGTIFLNATKDIIISAGEKVYLKGGSASLTVGPGQVLSKPQIETGDSGEGDAAGAAQKTVENLINKGTDVRKWIASLGGLAARIAEEQLHLFTKGKALANQLGGPYRPNPNDPFMPYQGAPPAHSDPFMPGNK